MGDDFEQGGPYRGPSRAAPYALSRLSGPVSLVDAAREIENADAWIGATSSAKLDVIAQQIRQLQQEAQRVMDEARRNAALHRAEARFNRHPGRVYHLYERDDGKLYWSLLSPADWRGQPPHRFAGTFRLETDHSFTQLAPDGETIDTNAAPVPPRLTTDNPSERLP